jgi:DNA invertase Pin-like site-specific DNA recombinase
MTTAQDPTPVVALIRQSKEKDSKLSPDTQRGGIMTFAEQRTMRIVKWLEELDVPGDAFRPVLERAVRMVEQGEAQALVLWKVDRLGREPEGMYAARGRIERAGGTMHFADEAFELDSEAGDYLFAMFAARAKAERRRIGANWRNAITDANGRGVHQGDAYGYYRAPKVPLQVEPSEAGALKVLFESRAQRKSWKACAEAMSAAGYKPRRGSKWSTSTLKWMLKNTVYLGWATQGELVNKHAHPSLVSQELFEAANRVKGSHHPRTDEWLLSGLVRCQVCRASMIGHKAPRGRKTKGGYGCRRRHLYVNAERLEALVTEAAFARHDILMDSAHRELNIAELDAAVETAKRTLAKLYVVQAKAAYPELMSEDVQQAEVAVARAEQQRSLALETYAPEGVNLLFSLRDEWENMTAEQHNQALTGLLDFVIVHPSREAAIIWRGGRDRLGPTPKTGSGQKGGPREFPPFPWPLRPGVEGPLGVLGFEVSA